MSVLPIYLYGSDVLRAKAKSVTALDDSLVRLMYDMFETMHKANGIGLAATQVGDLRRVIVLDISAAMEPARQLSGGDENEDGESWNPPKESSEGVHSDFRTSSVRSPLDLREKSGQPPPKADEGPHGASPQTLVVINPKIISVEGSWVMEEGCLSIPDVRAEVERAEHIRVKFRDANFNEVELSANELLGRVILHEMDHLDGILFVDHLSGAKRTLLKSKLNRIKKGETDASYPVVTAQETGVTRRHFIKFRNVEAST